MSSCSTPELAPILFYPKHADVQCTILLHEQGPDPVLFIEGVMELRALTKERLQRSSR